ncbi:AarF/ABC1/UbiB kinase family protein [Microbacterium sp. RU33B]|uniref:ABC1 kinase family protein n=1 Tax=Microbacterium sp. RU33B TaxID=1907390 RepID=UPI0009644689|nr:AarF/UbiB family protein [Microbacterium sp. RU33B]SIT86668.1 ubiquinone biosynthesis protein [Microbacterium sp. RU33B]
MPTWLLAVLLAVVFAVPSAWVSRRLLDDQVGWARSIVVAVVVFLVGAPVTVWALRREGGWDGQHITIDGWTAAGLLLLSIGWLFVAVVVVVLTLEFLWPSRGPRNPIAVVRGAFRRRRRALRYTQIVAIASRHGLGIVRAHRDGTPDDLPAALVAAMDEAGVTFVKLGQVLSARDDVLPPELTSALATLQSDSAPLPWERVRTVIEAQLGRPLEEVFATIDETPLAAASVAQVHAATLRDGAEVIVKVQRPDARAQVRTDLDILGTLAQDAERRMAWARDYGAVALADEFAQGLREELDYRIEMANQEMLRAVVERSGIARMHVPHVYEEISTEQMIVQQRAEGEPFARVDAASLDPESARAIADDVLDSFFDQMAVRGVFHADLHAGNLMLAADGTVSLIDFGAVGILEKSLRRLLLPLLVALSNEDDIAATDIVLMLIAEPDGGVDRDRLRHDIGVALTRVHNAGIGANVFRELIGILRRHRVGIPPSLLLVFRSLGSLDGALRLLDPDYDMVTRALDRAPHFSRKTLSLRSATLTAQTELALGVERLRRVPQRVERILGELESGSLTVRLRADEGGSAHTWIDRIVGQLTTVLIGIALVVTGLLVSMSTDGPLITPEVSVFAVLGSLMGLGGMLLLLRALRTVLRRRDPRDVDRR